MRPIRTTLLMLATCLPVLPGCTGPTQFTSALTDPGETRHDSRLVGTWHAKGTQDASGPIVSIRPRKDNQLTILYRSNKEILRLTGYASTLGGDVYYNVKPDMGSYFRAYSGATEAPHFLLFRVEFINDDKLFVWTSRLPTEEKYVRKARSVSLESGSGYTLVEQSREELLATIRELSPKKFFAYQLGPFFRVADPAERYGETLWSWDDKSDCAVGTPFSAGLKGVSWSGECMDGKASGEGVLEFDSDDGRKVGWKGKMIQGRPDGPGQCRREKTEEWGLCER